MHTWIRGKWKTNIL